MQVPRLLVPGPRLVRPLSVPLSTLPALANFIRDRLDALAPMRSRRDAELRALPGGGDRLADSATAIAAAAAPFAPSSFARARLLRQMHACGLLTAQESAEAQLLLGVAQSG